MLSVCPSVFPFCMYLCVVDINVFVKQSSTIISKSRHSFIYPAIQLELDLTKRCSNEANCIFHKETIVMSMLQLFVCETCIYLHY